jgi:hypothetical protein
MCCVRSLFSSCRGFTRYVGDSDGMHCQEQSTSEASPPTSSLIGRRGSQSGVVSSSVRQRALHSSRHLGLLSLSFGRSKCRE